jgi:hypothetical protein
MNLPDESFCDVSGAISAPNDDHAHPANLNVHPGTAKATDFKQSEGVEVPSRASRERVNPAVANDKRREPFIDVTSIESPPGQASEGDTYGQHAAHSSTATPTPKRL